MDNGGKSIFVYDETARAPSVNLAINKFYLDSVKNNKFDFVFRIYTHTQGIILGSNESSDDVNLEKCIKQNVEVVRRPTGGSFVYVDNLSTLCYSMFFSRDFADRKNIHNIDDIYGSIVSPLRAKLGDKFEIQGNYYLRIKQNGESLPVAGHSIYTTSKGIQFDGIVHLEKPNVVALSEIAKLRTLYSDGERKLVKMDGEYYNQLGRRTKPKGKLNMVADENELLRKMPSLKEGNSNKVLYIHLLKQIANDFAPDLREADTPSAHYYGSFIESELKNSTPKMKAQGHCFVDFLEPETKY